MSKEKIRVTYCKGVLSLWSVRRRLVMELRLPVYIWRTKGKDRRSGKDRRKGDRE